MAKEKKPMKKGVKIFLGILVAITVVAMCMGAVALYLIHEKGKPIFEFPEIIEVPSATELPTDAKDAAAYLERLYDNAIRADDVEGAWHTDVQIGTLTANLKDADAQILQYVVQQSTGAISALYPSASEVVMSTVQDAPEFKLPAESITDYRCHQGELNEEEDKDDTASYYLDFTCEPAKVDAEKVQTGSVYQQATETLASALNVEEFQITADSETVSAHTDRISDDLLSLNITKDYTVKAKVRLTEEYAALTSDGLVEVEFPYRTVQTINFAHYGIRFLERQFVVREDDLEALPMTVTVHSTATKADYKLTYELSDNEVMSVDETGVVNVHAPSEEEVYVTATLEYDGHVYQDTIKVYITELEVKEDA